MREVKIDYNLKFDILCDEYNNIANLFGISYPLPDIVQSIYESGGLDITKENGDDSLIIPLPTVYVIDKQGKIIMDFYDPDYTNRLEPSEIVEFLKSNVNILGDTD